MSRRGGAVRLALLLLVALLAAVPPASAAPPPPLRAGAEALVGLFNGKTQPERHFSPAFLAQVPAAQVKAISSQLTGQLGAARGVERMEAKSANAGTVFLAFDRGTLQLELAVDAQPPHLIQGLLVVGSRVTGDSFTKVAEELKALPGQTSLGVARLGETAPVMLVEHQAGVPMAVGSAFKLFLLAELDRSIAAGERKWNDVVPLTHRSLPSGVLQDWPQGTPLTLQTLAGLMISQSDNSATDTLLHLLGREKVEAMLPLVGVKAPERNRPFLSTLEAFALKGGDPEHAKAWLSGNEAQRRALLERIAGVGADMIDITRLNAAPNFIDSVEWFVSTEDLIRTLDWLRRNGSKEGLGILAINPGIARAAASRFGYVGYKGGSESGVVAMSFLVRTKSGAWHAIAAAWNNPAAKVEEDRFILLVSRAVALLGE